jgi:hypothetical protein
MDTARIVARMVLTPARTAVVTMSCYVCESVYAEM